MGKTFRGHLAGVDDVSVLDATMIFDETQRLLNQAVILHREAFTKSQAELNRCEADLKRLTEEKNALKRLYKLAVAHKKQIDLIEQLMKTFRNCQLQSIREESLARAKKIEECETLLAAELAKAASVAEKAKANTEAIVNVYRDDAEAANAQVKKIFDAAQVRLEHAKCQSPKETLEEVHARGFDLTADIENAKELEAEAEAFLSDDDNFGSVSRSESGKDRDEAPRD
ncbi:uncharacterized protein [Nicotiana sylvestris]|uniref:uncharacterized protein n=1 Tax=Nicotiana sylvestris TaxID=4096 RepID=UPI00388C440E